MSRVLESGVLRSIQGWVISEAREIAEYQLAGIRFIAEDEGNYESKLDLAINRGELCVFVSTPALRHVTFTERHAELSMRVFECVTVHRSASRVVDWTALRVAESVLALFDNALMDRDPFAHFFCEGNSLTLESQTPWLVYNVRMIGKMILKKQT